MRLHAAFGFLFTFEIKDIDKEVFAIQVNLTCRHLFEVVIVVEFHEFFEARYTIVIPVCIL